jgi:hypothetical protein
MFVELDEMFKRSEIDKLDHDLTASDFGLQVGETYYLGVTDYITANLLEIPFQLTHMDSTDYSGIFQAENLEIYFIAECVVAVTHDKYVLFEQKDGPSTFETKIKLGDEKYPLYLRVL